MATRVVLILTLLVLLAACAPLRDPAVALVPAPQQLATPAPSLPATRLALTPSPVPSATSLLPTRTLVPTASVTPTATPKPGPPRVGIQVGHWRSQELPDELERLRSSSGAFAAGIWEWELNYDIARRVEALLTAEGLLVDVLPATVPPSYDADAFVALHADGSPGAGARGYKLATPWRTSGAAQALYEAIDVEYGAATGLPRDGAITRNMRGYYAFAYRRHRHAIARTTPAVILEMGYLTSAADRAVMLGQADRVAEGVARGVLRYLRERDPADSAALVPPEFPTLQARADDTGILSAPDPGSRVLALIPRGRRVFAFQERDGWLQVTVGGQWNVIGWVPREALEVAPDLTPLPLPTEPASDT